MNSNKKGVFRVYANNSGQWLRQSDNFRVNGIESGYKVSVCQALNNRLNRVS